MIKFTVVYAAFIWLMSISAWATENEAIQFKNFGENIELTPSGGHYRVADTELLVQLAPRLIVQTNKITSERSLVSKMNAIAETKLIFEGHDSNIYLLQLKGEQGIQKALNDTSELTGVVLVQPDILQLKDHTASGLTVGRKEWQHGNHHRDRNAQPLESRAEKLNNKYAAYMEKIGIQSLRKDNLGDGVRLAIIDDGIDLERPGLSNVRSLFAYDVELGELDASPKTSIDTHGSKVAEVILGLHGKQAFFGIAPNVDLIAIRSSLTWTSQTILSFQLANLNKADVINCSWRSPRLLEPVQSVVQDLSQHGRQGKGVAVVFAAGNDGKAILPLSTEAAISDAVVVGAHNFSLQPLRRSNFGESVDFFGYGQRVFIPSSDGYEVFAGTSLSAAVTSGMLALLIKKYPSKTTQELVENLSERLAYKGVSVGAVEH